MEELMAKYLAGDLSEEERTSFETQLAEEEAVSREFEAYLNVWQLTHASDSTISFDTTAAWKVVKEQLTEETKVVPITPKRPFSFLKIAATILILAVAGYFVFTGGQEGAEQSQLIEVASTNGLKEVELPDGSKVRMNANSTLTYSSDFNSDHRTVTLVGRADFDVMRNESLPFIVEAGASRIEVLGTNFDITAYPDQMVELHVTEGKVAFAAKVEVDKGEVVTGGQKATLDIQSNEIQVSNIENLNYNGWWTKKLVYEDASLKEVLEDLEKVYWVEFDWDEQDFADCGNLTSTFENLTIDGVIQILEVNYPGMKSSKPQENKIKLSGKGCSD